MDILAQVSPTVIYGNCLVLASLAIQSHSCYSCVLLTLRFSNFSLHWNHLESLLNLTFLGPTPRVCDSTGLGRVLRGCISKFPGLAGPGTPVIFSLTLCGSGPLGCTSQPTAHYVNYLACFRQFHIWPVIWVLSYHHFGPFIITKYFSDSETLLTSVF